MAKTPSSDIAMARTICAKIEGPNKGYQYENGSRDDYPMMEAVLTAFTAAKTECLQLIADLPTGSSEDVERGREDCYRVIEATLGSPSHIVANPQQLCSEITETARTAMAELKRQARAKLTDAEYEALFND